MTTGSPRALPKSSPRLPGPARPGNATTCSPRRSASFVAAGTPPTRRWPTRSPRLLWPSRCRFSTSISTTVKWENLRSCVAAMEPACIAATAALPTPLRSCWPLSDASLLPPSDAAGARSRTSISSWRWQTRPHAISNSTRARSHWSGKWQAAGAEWRWRWPRPVPGRPRRWPRCRMRGAPRARPSSA